MRIYIFSYTNDKIFVLGVKLIGDCDYIILLSIITMKTRIPIRFIGNMFDSRVVVTIKWAQELFFLFSHWLYVYLLTKMIDDQCKLLLFTDDAIKDGDARASLIVVDVCNEMYFAARVCVCYLPHL